MPADVLALLDLDHTLLPHDSDEQWVAFLIDRGLLDRARYAVANRELIDRYNRGEADLVVHEVQARDRLAGKHRDVRPGKPRIDAHVDDAIA